MAPKKRPPIERFEEKIQLADTGCWEWAAYKTDGGYGRFYLDGRGALAHRWSYEYHVGEIPEGLVIDHLCRNRSCVNPEHLEPVTLQENVVRGVGPAKRSAIRWTATHCANGHEFTEENIYLNGRDRVCRICKKQNARDYYERNRELVIQRAREWASRNPDKAREMSREGQRRYRQRQKEAA